MQTVRRTHIHADGQTDTHSINAIPINAIHATIIKKGQLHDQGPCEPRQVYLGRPLSWHNVYCKFITRKCVTLKMKAKVM